MNFKILTAVSVSLLFILFAGCSNSIFNPVEKAGYGTVSITATASANSQFSQVAKKARITVTANDMSASSKELSVSGNAVKGVMNSIPSGKNRKFDMQILDSVGDVKYRGQAVTDIATDQTVTVPITLVRTSGTASVNGTITEDSITTGYQFYKFVVDSMGALGGGIYEACLTETHFLKGDTAYPKSAGDFTVVSSTAGNVAPLFDGDLTTGTSTGLYVKIATAPWQWIIDIGTPQTFNGLLIACWQTWFYKVPVSVTVYGASSAEGPWVQIGGHEFTSAYQTATVDLFY